MPWARALFEPRGVAVAGSVSPGKIARVLIDQLVAGGFPNVVAVNPSGTGTDDVRGIQSFSECGTLALPIDLAVIASPAATVADVLEDAGAAGVHVAVIITAGFSEVGQIDEEAALRSVAARHGIRLVGPNCAGVVNTKWNLFPTLETRPPQGDVAFVSQSGALGGAVLSWAEDQRVGFSKFVSYGNAVDLTEIDFLDALREDDDTRVVCLYIETVSDGRRFLKAASRLAATKPLIVLKSGRSDAGGRATLSHTGSMAGSDAVYDAAIRQCGAIRVDAVEDMFDLCRAFVSLPPMHGRRLAIVTNSGGPGVLAADRAEAVGLDVSRPSDDLRARLAAQLPPVCALGNPFDLTVQANEETVRNTLVEVLREEYDVALAIDVNTPYLDAAPIARGIVDAARVSGKPVTASFLAGRTVEAALPALASGGVPNFASGERAVQALAAFATVGFGTRRPEGIEPSGSPSEALPWDGAPLEPELMDWLEQRGVSVIPRVWAHTATEAVDAAQRFGTPVAIKVVSREILHKTDAGGVELGANGADAVRVTFTRLSVLPGFEGVLLTPMVHDAVEVLVGLSRDPQFGPVVAVGMGGIFTEILRDVSFRVAPVREDVALQMFDELKANALLRGARGRPPCDLDRLAALVSRVSCLPFEVEDIAQLDLNPVFAGRDVYWVADARLVREGGRCNRGEGRSVR